MSPEEIINAYNVVAQDVKNNAANNAAAIGNSQRSLGTYASNVASPSGQTNGLANYTYNRVMRPTVDTKAAALTTAGKSDALERLLQTQLLAAKGAYEDAKNAYSLASTNYTTKVNSSSTTGNSTGTGYSEGQSTQWTGREADKNGNTAQRYPDEGAIIGTGSSGNGVMDVIIADGGGGYKRVSFFTNDKDVAKRKAIEGGHAKGIWNVDTLTMDTL